MVGQKRLINFKLTPEMIEKLTKQKSLYIETSKQGDLELVMKDVRIKIDENKEEKNATAIYYNNNSSTLHYFGNSVPSIATAVKKTEDKKHTKTKSEHATDKDSSITKHKNELLDIPNTTTDVKKPSTSTVSTTHTPKPKPKLTSSSASTSSNIPISQSSTPSRSINTLQKQSKQSSSVSNSKSYPEEKHSLRARILHRLALHPWSSSELIKSLNRAQHEKCDQLEIADILEKVGILIKKDERKKFCLKPSLYKEIKIWDWPFYNSTEKHTVADNANEAYDLLKIHESDRLNLYHPDSKYQLSKSPAPKSKKTQHSPAILRHSTPQDNKSKGKATPTSNHLNTSPHLPSTPTMVSTPQTKLNSPYRTKRRSSLTPQHVPPSSQQKIPSTPSKKATSKIPPQSIETPTKAKSEEESPSKRMKIEKEEDGHQTLPNISIKPEPAALNNSTPVERKPSTPSTPTSSPAAKAALIPVPRSIKPIDIPTQRAFSAYCTKYEAVRDEYSRVKQFFIKNYPHYIKILKETEPPKGAKRSYHDLKAEYQSLIKNKFLQVASEDNFKETEELVEECTKKRRRLNYMWATIKQNIGDHDYKVPKKFCL